MPTIVAHALVAATAGAALRLPAKAVVAGAIAAMLPDLDVIGARYGVAWDSPLAHRGATHSLCAALFAGFALAWMLFRAGAWRTPRWWGVAAFFAAAIASHGVLDAMTNGGSGVAFFWPFTGERYKFSWQPIEVSPFAWNFFSARGLRVMGSELAWIGIPCLVVLVAVTVKRIAARDAPRR